MFSVSRPGLAIGAIVFDMDGVLVLSSEIHRQAFEEILTPLGVGFSYERFAGWRTNDVIRTVFEEAGLPLAGDAQQVAAYAQQKSLRSRELMAQAQGSLAPGCVTVVTDLAKRFRLALASSGSRKSVEAFLEVSALRSQFQSVLSGDDVERAKPDPELFARSIASLGVPAEQCVVVEDSLAGVVAAQAAGATAVGLGAARREELIAAGANAVVDSLDELAQLLDRWREHQ